MDPSRILLNLFRTFGTFWTLLDPFMWCFRVCMSVTGIPLLNPPHKCPSITQSKVDFSFSLSLDQVAYLFVSVSISIGYLEAGVKASQLIIGVPYYGHVWYRPPIHVFMCIHLFGWHPSHCRLI